MKAWYWESWKKIAKMRLQVTIAPLLEASHVQATADLLQSLGWRQVRNKCNSTSVLIVLYKFSFYQHTLEEKINFYQTHVEPQVAILAEESLAEQLGEALARARICLIHRCVDINIQYSEVCNIGRVVEHICHFKC